MNKICCILAVMFVMASYGQNESVKIRLQNREKWFVVSDRNAGVNVPQGGVALNYTNDTTHADHNNLLFKGDYYAWGYYDDNAWYLYMDASYSSVGEYYSIESHSLSVRCVKTVR